MRGWGPIARGPCATLIRPSLPLGHRLLEMDPSKRITGKEALQHPYFDQVREPGLAPPYI